MGAKVIAVADYFEAITAKRHYREPMAIDTAFGLLREGIGSHFESSMVEALIAYYTKVYLEENSKTVWYGTDRRKPRVPCRIPVFCQVNGRTLSTTSEDISASGVYIAAQEEIPEGVPVILTIALPESSSKMIRAVGRVAWVNKVGNQKKPEFPAGFGVELLEFKGATGANFRNFMSRYAPAAYALGNI